MEGAVQPLFPWLRPTLPRELHLSSLRYVPVCKAPGRAPAYANAHFAIPMNEAWLKLTGTYSPAMNSSIPCVIRCSATVRQLRFQRGFLSNHIPTHTPR